MVLSYERLLSLYPAETGIKFDFAVQLLKAHGSIVPNRSGRCAEN